MSPFETFRGKRALLMAPTVRFVVIAAFSLTAATASGTWAAAAWCNSVKADVAEAKADVLRNQSAMNESREEFRQEMRDFRADMVQRLEQVQKDIRSLTKTGGR